ncbi:DUF916 domain-containing protein [Spirillospora sp. NPDC047279]|uniref:WxL protein peptidoglycan domain-containing protein n=1 Tax=Spirillospora sp. NPDC047279 TaxID=3155478 RepID=UPI0033EC8969
MIRAALALALTLGVTAALQPPPALAATAAPEPSKGGFTWAVQPSGPKGPTGRDHFVYSAAPGQKIEDTVGITNGGRSALTFKVYATDAFNTADGSFALLTAAQRPRDVGTWTTFKAATYEVKPGKRLDVPFTVTVPHDATPGDHSGGVIAAVTEQVPNARGQRVNVDRRVAARVYLRINGPLSPAVQIDDITTAHDTPTLGSGPLTVTYRVRNTGNVRVTAGARITAQGPVGTLGKPVSRTIPELLPGAGYTFTERIPGVAPAGRLTASVKLTPADPGNGSPLRPTTRAASTWAVPWLPLAATVLLIVAAIALLRRRKTS